MEPVEYFHYLKTNLQGAQKEKFDAQMETIAQQILAAERIGQKNFLDRLAFTFQCIQKEQQLLAAGIDKYLLKDDITTFLKKVTPKDSVKLIELKRYPRPIPIDVLEKIEQVKALNVFDDFFVVFTDFTEEKYETPEEKALVARNRDPVVFGWFKHDATNFKHDRVYYIADWIDDYCELDFAKLVQAMSEKIPGHKPGEIKPGVIDLGAMSAKTEEILKNHGGWRSGGLVTINPSANVLTEQTRSIPVIKAPGPDDKSEPKKIDTRPWYRRIFG